MVPDSTDPTDSVLAEEVNAWEGIVDPTASGWSQASYHRSADFGQWERRLLIFFGLAILALLLVARCLPPNPNGMGTHRSLGLPACGSMALFGVPCPSCGMTTSWAWFTRGELYHSWMANPGGLALGFFVLVMAPWMVASGIKGRWWPMECRPRYVLAAGLSVVAITVIQWLLRVFG